MAGEIREDLSQYRPSPQRIAEMYQRILGQKKVASESERKKVIADALLRSVPLRALHPSRMNQ
jgi:hypothetical protein